MSVFSSMGFYPLFVIPLSFTLIVSSTLKVKIITETLTQSLSADLRHLCSGRGKWLTMFHGASSPWWRISLPLFMETKEATATHTGLNSRWPQSMRRNLEVSGGGHSVLMGLQVGDQRLGVTIQNEMSTMLLWCMSWQNLEQRPQPAVGGLPRWVFCASPEKALD